MASDERSIQETIRRFREEKGLSQSNLSKLSGVDRGYINQLEHGKVHSITLRTARLLARGLGISADAFLRDHLRGDHHQETSEEILERLRLAQPVSVPVYTEFPIHAGDGVEPVEYVYRARTRPGPKNIEGYLISGDSMAPHVMDNDIVIVDRDGQIDNGDIVVALVRGRLHINWFKMIGGKPWLVSKYGGKIKFKECQVAALVIEVIRRLK